jgi:hypothetical protein
VEWFGDWLVPSAGIAIETQPAKRWRPRKRNQGDPIYVQVFVSSRCLPLVSSLRIVSRMNNIIALPRTFERWELFTHRRCGETLAAFALEILDTYDLWYGFARSKWTSVVALRSQNDSIMDDAVGVECSTQRQPSCLTTHTGFESLGPNHISFAGSSQDSKYASASTADPHISHPRTHPNPSEMFTT